MLPASPRPSSKFQVSSRLKLNRKAGSCFRQSMNDDPMSFRRSGGEVRSGHFLTICEWWGIIKSAHAHHQKLYWVYRQVLQIVICFNLRLKNPGIFVLSLYRSFERVSQRPMHLGVKVAFCSSVVGNS